MLDVQLFGMRPGWHHLINLLLHTANAILLFIWLQRLTAATWSSLTVAALFSLHPLHVESVAWAAERKDVLSTFFLLLTLLAYGAYTKLLRSTSSARPHSIPNSPGANPAEPRPRGFGLKVGLTKKVGFAELVPPIRRAYVLALLSFTLGLMSKPMLVT